MRIAVLNGPNLNLLGTREPGLYGTVSFEALERLVREEATRVACEIQWMQSNHEGDLVEAIQRLPGQADGFLLNAAALTHTSLAIRDAVLAVDLPFVEVHLSNIFAREPERRRSWTADRAIGVVAGFGVEGYRLALQGLLQHLHA